MIKSVKLVKLVYILTLLFLFVLEFMSPLTYAQETFNKSLVFKDNDIYSLPKDFSSPQSIQIYLESKGSILANTSIVSGLYAGGECAVVNGSNVCYTQDPIYDANKFPGIVDNLNPSKNLAPYNGMTIKFSDFVWMVSRADFGSGCDLTYQGDICYQNSVKPINPAFILSLIQKESRLVYGQCAKIDADTNTACQPYSQVGNINKLAFRMDRATGYFCFETTDKTKGCWDENPSWRSYKGLFRQVYHATRRIRLLEQMCIKGGVYSFKNSAGDFKVGNTVNIDGEQTLLQNGITCALYVYTPHFWGNNLHWLIMSDLNGFFDFRDEYNLPDNYKPNKVSSTQF